MSRVMNFSAGPAALPLAALERAREELLDFGGTGMSVMEQSHRGKDYERVHDEAILLLRKLLDVPADHDVLFLQGGASQQFAMIPLNFLDAGARADYVLTGAWGEKALGEGQVVARMFGAEAHVAASTGTGDGKEKSYTRAPRPAEVTADARARYLHVTSNETIHGVQFGADPARPVPTAPAGIPLVCDMSSDFLWQRFDVRQYGLVYAGAQKNIGPSGVVVVLARKDLVASGRKDIPKIFQYRTHADANSLYNTPPTFGIYLVRNVLAWVDAAGGLDGMRARNLAKAAAVYGAIDAAKSFYDCPVERESRSVMNIVFRLPPGLEDRFVSEAKKAGMVGLKGHRSVGGIRASLYNAVEVAHAEALASFMKEFARANG